MNKDPFERMLIEDIFEIDLAIVLEKSDTKLRQTLEGMKKRRQRILNDYLFYYKDRIFN
jgi:hypothetical protein